MGSHRRGGWSLERRRHLGEVSPFCLLEVRCWNAKKCDPRRSQSETVPESFLCRKTAHPNSQRAESTASAGSFSGSKSQPTTH